MSGSSGSFIQLTHPICEASTDAKICHVEAVFVVITGQLLHKNILWLNVHIFDSIIVNIPQGMGETTVMYVA
jgi:hypothetical protein